MMKRHPLDGEDGWREEEQDGDCSDDRRRPPWSNLRRLSPRPPKKRKSRGFCSLVLVGSHRQIERLSNADPTRFCS